MSRFLNWAYFFLSTEEILFFGFITLCGIYLSSDEFSLPLEFLSLAL